MAVDDATDQACAADILGVTHEALGFVRGELLSQGARLLTQLARLGLQPRHGVRQLACLDGQLPDGVGHDIPEDMELGERAPAAHERDARAALVSLPGLHGDDADGTGAGDVGPAACRQVEVLDLDEAQCAATHRFLAQRQRGGLLGAHKAHRHRPGSATPRGWPRLRPARSHRVLAYRGDRWSIPRCQGGSSASGSRTAAQRPQTTRAVRCAAACGPAAGASPPFPRPACRRRGTRPGRAPRPRRLRGR